MNANANINADTNANANANTNTNTNTNANANANRQALSAFVVGLLFALGLGLAGMTLPERVVGFLDVFGNWNPSLVFVMAAAVVVHGVLYRIIRKRESPLFSSGWHVPNRKDINPPLLIGSSLFGIGWGLAGYCPAPVITALPSLDSKPIVFVGAMVAGMFLYRLVEKHLPWKP